MLAQLRDYRARAHIEWQADAFHRAVGGSPGEAAPAAAPSRAGCTLRRCALALVLSAGLACLVLFDLWAARDWLPQGEEAHRLLERIRHGAKFALLFCGVVLALLALHLVRRRALGGLRGAPPPSYKHAWRRR
jgi:hypothetical protein